MLIALGAFLLVDDAGVGLEPWQEPSVLVVGFALLFFVALRHAATKGRVAPPA